MGCKDPCDCVKEGFRAAYWAVCERLNRLHQEQVNMGLIFRSYKIQEHCFADVTTKEYRLIL